MAIEWPPDLCRCDKLENSYGELRFTSLIVDTNGVQRKRAICKIVCVGPLHCATGSAPILSLGRRTTAARPSPRRCVPRSLLCRERTTTGYCPSSSTLTFTKLRDSTPGSDTDSFITPSLSSCIAGPKFFFPTSFAGILYDRRTMG